MTTPADALVRLALHAALADGAASDAERQLVAGFASGLPEPRPDLASIEAELRARRSPVGALAAAVGGDDAGRRSAFEMCAAICAADGPPSPAEQWFLDELRHALGLDPVVAADSAGRVAAIAAVPVPPAGTIPPPSPAATVPPAPAPDPEALERTILNHALLAGGLELLPDTLAAMAIIPVQMKLVHAVGKAHGYELDRGHVQEFLGVVGIGVASQVLERYATRLVKGLAGRFLGGIVGSIAGQATESTMAFATTYAMGQAARQYYAGGRRLGAVELRSLFSGLLPQARELQQRLAPRIRSQGESLRGTDLAALTR